MYSKDRQRNISVHHNIFIHMYLGCLHEIEIQFSKNTVDTKVGVPMKNPVLAIIDHCLSKVSKLV